MEGKLGEAPSSNIQRNSKREKRRYHFGFLPKLPDDIEGFVI